MQITLKYGYRKIPVLLGMVWQVGNVRFCSGNDSVKPVTMAAVLRPAEHRAAPVGGVKPRGAHLQVPVDEIFKIEFAALQYDKKRQEKIRDMYEQYAAGLANSIKEWLDANKIGDIKNADERELFGFISEVFRKDFKASITYERVLSTSIESNIFNCYSSSILLADALSRAGKGVGTVLVPGHVFLAGDYVAFETTASQIWATFPKSKLGSKYPVRQELEADAFITLAYNWAGDILRKAGRLDEAMAANEAAIKTNPAYVEARVNKGSVLVDMGRNAEALTVLEEAISMNPVFADSWKSMGIALYGIGRLDDALYSYDKAARRDPFDAEIWRRKADALYALGQYRKALSASDRSISIDKKNHEAWLCRGNVLDALGRHQEAVAAYGRSIRLDPENACAWKGKGTALRKMNRYAESAKCFEKAKEIEAQKSGGKLKELKRPSQ